MVATSFSQLITLSFYYLVINPTNTGVFRLKLPGDVQSGPRENLSTNTINKNFAPNLLSQGSIGQNYLSKNVKNLSF